MHAAVGAKIRCLYVFTGRICREAANCRYLNLNGEVENQHFRSAGAIRCMIHLKFGTAEGHVRPLIHAKFHANRCTWERGPKIWKFPLFGKASPRRGEPFD